jgi:predicted HicB family RNase H-like nuclease
VSTTKSSDVLHVRIARLLRRALKIKAAETGRPMRELVEEALRAYLTPRRAR